MWTDASLKRFGNTIQKVMNGHDMTRQESYDMFRQIMLNEQPDLHQGAFLAALTAKGETPHEIAGAWQAILDLDTNRLSMEFRVPLVENCGTGMDEMKTFNVSSAAAVVAAAGGVRIARHGSRALTSTCGTADLLEAIGINVECAVEDVGRSINTVGIGMFNGMSTSIHPRSLARILSLIRFGSTLNIAASLASPCKPTHGLRGVYSAAMVNPVCAVMKEIGYERALVVHGFDEREERGMDELSTIGRTVIRELKDDGSETTFSIVPEDVGLERSRYEAIAPMNTIKAESIRFLKIISGIGYPECCDIVCLNAGAVFYLVGSAEDIRHGVEISREIIESGRASAKLVEWIQAQADTAGHGRRKFMSLVKEARMGHIFDHILS